MVSRTVLPAAIWIVILVGSLPAYAEEPTVSGILNSGPEFRNSVKAPLFELRADREIPLLLVSSAFWLVPEIVDRYQPSPNCHGCSAGSVNALDRPAINYENHGARVASDVLVVGIPLVAVGLGLLDAADWGWSGFLEDVVLIAEAMTVTGMTHQFVRHAVQRPRPYMYREDCETSAQRRGNANDGHSFFSGHTSLSFAAGTAFAYIFSVRRPKSRLKPVVWICAMGLSATVGVLRVANGDHFWTDVGAGALVGAAYGILIPATHRIKKKNPDGPFSVKLMTSPQYFGVYGSF